jgi:hypothetical protein
MKLGELEAYAAKLAADRKAGKKLSKADAKLLAEMDGLTAVAESFRRALEQDPDLSKMRLGLKSPDPAERERFHKLEEFINDKTLPELRPWFGLVKPAKKSPGRRPKHDDAKALVCARRLIADGRTIYGAAKEATKGYSPALRRKAHRRLEERLRREARKTA